MAERVSYEILYTILDLSVVWLNQPIKSKSDKEIVFSIYLENVYNWLSLISVMPS